MNRMTLLATAIGGILLCSAASAAVPLNDGLDGSWFEPASSGRGVSVDIFPVGNDDAVAGFAYYAYDAAGQPTWVLFTGEFFDGAQSASGMPVSGFSGGTFGNPFSAPTESVIGTANATFNSCNSLTVSLDMDAASGLSDVTLNLSRTQTNLGLAANPLCQETAEVAQCPVSTTALGDACVLPTSITGDLYLPAGKKYVIEGRVAVESGGRLTIAPGTVLEGSSNTATPNFLAVLAGGQIFANGTASQPITFRGPEDFAGSWAGVVLAGNSNCNVATAGQPCVFEGDTSITYGGSNPTDSSGSLSYVRILNAGQVIRQDEELNALTLLAVGSGTRLDHIQADGGLDDGFEFFGGTVDGRYLVCSNMADDCFDFDQGYQGRIQFALAFQGDADAFTGDPRGIESDNNRASPNIAPRTEPTLANITLVGNGSIADPDAEGIHLRRGTGGHYFSVVATGYAGECLDFEDTQTYTNGGSATTQGPALTMTGSVIGACGLATFEESSSDPYLISSWFAAGSGNADNDPMLVEGGFLPMSGSSLAQGGTSPSDAFFAPVPYRGAFASEFDNWTSGWTVNLP